MDTRLAISLALLFFLLVYTYMMSRKWYWDPSRDPIVLFVLGFLGGLWGVQATVG